jgi:MFS family permease
MMQVLFATPSLLALYAGISCVLFLNATIFAWLPALLTRSDGMSMGDAAMRSALVLLVAACGTVLGGILVDRLKRFGLSVMMLAPGIYALLSALAFAIAFTALTGDSRFIALCIGGFFMSATFGPMFTACQRLVHPGLRATVVGVINVIGQIIGGLGPLSAGLLSDVIGLESALALVCLVMMAGGIAMALGATYYEMDVVRTERLSDAAAQAAGLAPMHA